MGQFDEKYRQAARAAREAFEAKYPGFMPEHRANFACPPGWIGLVSEIAELVGPEVRAIQVKVKWGFLEIYLPLGVRAAFAEKVNEARQRALDMCSLCGSPVAKLPGFGLPHPEPMCPTHQAERNMEPAG